MTKKLNSTTQKVTISTLFSTSTYYALLSNKKSADLLRKDLLDEAYKIADFDEAGGSWSQKNYLGGFTSYSSMSRLFEFSSTFNDLKKLIDPHVKKYVQHLEYDTQGKSVEMTQMWVNIMPHKTTHSGHIHPLSFISGTFYVSTPKDSSTSVFEDPRLGFLMAAPPKKQNCKEQNKTHIKLKPQAGHLVLFESWLRHEVPPNPSQKDRVSISFNYNWL